MPGATKIRFPDVVQAAALLSAVAGEIGAPDSASRHMPVLAALASAGRRGLTQVQLASTLGVAPATMSRLIDLMEPLGIIVRASHPLDRRSKVIQLTELGHERLMAFEAQRRARCEQVFHDLPPDDLRMLKAILSRIMRNLDAPGGGDEG